MPTVRPFGRPVPVCADVHSLPTSDDVGEASSDLWAAILPKSRRSADADQPARLAIAIEWAAEYRLPPSDRAAASRKLVLWVTPATAEVRYSALPRVMEIRDGKWALTM